MATAVNNKEQIVLQNEKTVTIRPLVIARLRRVFDVWSEFEKISEGETPDELKILTTVAGICLEHDLKAEIDGKLWENDDKTVCSPDYMDYLENALDRETIEKVLLVCASIDLKGMRETLQNLALNGQTST